MGERVKKRGNKKLVMIIIGVVVLLSAILVGLYLVYTLKKTDDNSSQNEVLNYHEALPALNKSLNEQSLDDIIDNYGKYYDESIGEVAGSVPSKWDADMVNKAHLCLLYANKIENYTDVDIIYSLTEAAKKAGVKVDENSAGITQDDRDAIKEKAEAGQENSNEN